MALFQAQGALKLEYIENKEISTLALKMISELSWPKPQH